MVRSEADNDKGTERPKLTPKVWTLGSIPATDKGFLEWCEYQSKKRSTLSLMKLYVQQLNLAAKMLHERQQKKQNALADTAEGI